MKLNKKVALLTLYGIMFVMPIIPFMGCPMNPMEKALSPQRIEAKGETMGTTWSVKVYTNQIDWTPIKLTSFVQLSLDAVDRAMSTYKPDSDISRFNASSSTDWFEISEETAEVVELALSISQVSNGAFDITVGPLVNLWRFGPDKTPLTELPSQEKIESICEQTGWQHLDVRRTPTPAIRKDIPGLYIDLSAIAKGFAVDQVAKELLQRGIDVFMVEVGGETRCHGRKPDSSHPEGIPWTMGIESPAPSKMSSTQIHRVVWMDNNSMATSGDYRNYLCVDGVRFSHLIDPRTGRPREMFEEALAPLQRLASVTVMMNDCATADAWATAFFILGPDEGIILANHLDIPVLFLSQTVNGLQERSSTHFDARVQSALYE